jgi:AraC family transcriptional regulator
MLDTTALHRGAIAVSEYRCRFGPHDLPFPELHDAYSVSYVRAGTFGYHTQGKSFELVAGSVLIGRPGDEYACSHHHHGGGDECLAFKLGPEVVESLGAKPAAWRTPCLPPASELMVIGELAGAAADSCKLEAGPAHGLAVGPGLDELGLMLAARFVQLVGERVRGVVCATPSDRKRAVEAALWLDAHAHEAVDLQRTAASVELSAFHFLRVFKSVVGVTPHQYLVRSRIRHAASALVEEDRSISEIAFACGFGDLSNFVRTFRRAAGTSPRAFRNRARTGRATSRRARLEFRRDR